MAVLAGGAAWAQTPPDTSGIFYDQHPGARLPLAATFHDETGRAMTLGQAIDGAPTVLAIGYFHCPALCGIVRADLMQALSDSGLATPTQYRLIALSIDPAETPADAAHAKAKDLGRFPTPGAAGGWHFLTGGPASIGAITAVIGFHARYDASLKQFIHPAGLVFVTPSGRISSYLLGVGFQPADLRAGLQRAGADAIGPTASPILLLCFHFDPTTGRYTLAITRVLRAGSVLFLAIVAIAALRPRFMQGGRT